MVESIKDTSLAISEEVSVEIINDFTSDISEIEKAIQNSKDARHLGTEVKNQGVFGRFVGNFSGKNDEQLAKSVETLGLSLETTQKVLLAVLKVSHVKNTYLKDFHKVLVNRISKIEENIKTLDGNDKNADKATLLIVTRLKNQIDDRLKQEQLIKAHDKELDDLRSIVDAKDNLDSDQNSRIESLQVSLAQKGSLDERQSKEIALLQEFIKKLAKHLKLQIDHRLEQEKRIELHDTDLRLLKQFALDSEVIASNQNLQLESLKSTLEQGKKLDEAQSKMIGTLKSEFQKLESMAQNLDMRQKVLEAQEEKRSSLSGVVKNNFLSIISLILVLISLFLSLR